MASSVQCVVGGIAVGTDRPKGAPDDEGEQRELDGISTEGCARIELPPSAPLTAAALSALALTEQPPPAKSPVTAGAVARDSAGGPVQESGTRGETDGEGRCGGKSSGGGAAAGASGSGAGAAVAAEQAVPERVGGHDEDARSDSGGSTDTSHVGLSDVEEEAGGEDHHRGLHLSDFEPQDDLGSVLGS